MTSRFWRLALSFTLCLLTAAAMAWSAGAGEKAAAGESKADRDAAISGRELFLREWIPNDPRSHGGEAQLSANRFYRLKTEERTLVLTFPRSLVTVRRPRRGRESRAGCGRMARLH